MDGHAEPPVSRNELTGDPGVSVQAGVVHGGVHIGSPDTTTVPVPRQLPMAVPAFVNRQDQLAALDRLLLESADSEGSGRAVVVSALAGTPGVGKTALAVHWAHRVRRRYVDGDLYIDLCAHGPGPSVEAGQALEVLLRCLHVPPEQVPADTAGRAALYRSVLANKQMLILIDNAASPEQVRPLLPGSATSLALVTSRSALPGLIAREGATRMVLDVLTRTESLALLRDTIGRERVDSEPRAAEQVAAHCADLPLALRVIAERITAHPHAPLQEFAAELADERARMDALGTADDDLSDVRAAFTASYRSVDTDTARIFRFLALHPGVEISEDAAVVLCARPVAATRRMLESLAQSHLLQEVAHRRYRFHDLLRLYAAERGHDTDLSEERELTERRIIDWYLRSVDNASRIVLPASQPTPMQPSEDAPALEFADVESAMDWFERERENLHAALHTAHDHAHHDLAWWLPIAMSGLFELRGYWTAWRDIHTLGLRSAQATGQPAGLVGNHLGLGDALWQLGHRPDALDSYRQARIHARETGDGWAEGFALRQIAVLLEEQQRGVEATETATQAITVFRRIGERRGEAQALLTLAACDRRGRHPDRAAQRCEDAIAIFTELDDHWSIAWARCELGDLLSETTRWAEAAEHYRAALDTLDAFGDREAQARAHIGLAESHHALGENQNARTHLRAAQELLDAWDATPAEGLRERLRRVADQQSP